MPLTWYAKKKIWDMSPGYTRDNRRFDRPVNQSCMNCHNEASAVSSQTENHFQTVKSGIGCETWHGPGREHVALAQAGNVSKAVLKESVLNPDRWDRNLQMDLCQHCHLEGQSVWNSGIGAHQVDPRFPLAVHKAVFVAGTSFDSESQFNIAAQADRLRKSACFQKSGTMTCTTCHDPHRTSTAMNRALFNSTCRNCHHDPAHQVLCSFTRGNTDNCVSCHMKVGGTRDIPHVSFTDHYIRRNIESTSTGRESESPQSPSLVPVLWSSSIPEQLEQKGLAYFQYYQTATVPVSYLDSVITMLTAAERAGIQRPDGEAAYALATSYLLHSDAPKAVEYATRATTQNPKHARAFYILGEALAAIKKTDEAVVAHNRGIEAQPL
jgi:tetratricopeptide (TPR) repeat protein